MASADKPKNPKTIEERIPGTHWLYDKIKLCESLPTAIAGETKILIVLDKNLDMVISNKLIKDQKLNSLTCPYWTLEFFVPTEIYDAEPKPQVIKNQKWTLCFTWFLLILISFFETNFWVLPSHYQL